MARIIIGPYIRENRDDLDGWHLPPGFSRGVDFRSLPNMVGDATGRNIGVFFADKDTDFNSRTHTALRPRMDARTLREVEDQLDLRGGDAVQADNVAQWIRKAMRQHGDGTGQTRWKPLMPGSRSALQERRELTDPQRDVLREDYKQAWQQWESEGGPDSRHYLKWLGFQRRKFGLKQIEIERIQGELPKEKPLRPETTHTESFDGADKSTSVGYDQSWTTQATNGWQNTSNQAQRKFGGTDADYRLARCDSDVSGDDMRVEAELTQKPSATTSQVGVAVRCSSSVATTYYFAFHLNGTVYLAKFVTSTYTQIATTGYTVNVNDVLSSDVDGSDLDFLVNATSRLTGTDSSLTGYTRGGIYALNTTGTLTRFDDFTVEDITPGPGGILYTQFESTWRGTYRGIRGSFRGYR